MARRRRARYLFLSCICVLLIGCAGGALQRARHLDATENLTDAIREYTEAIKADSTQPEPYFERGYLRYRQGQFQPAMRDFQSARALDFSEPAYHLYYALCADTLQQVDSALAGYGEFVARYDRGTLAQRMRVRIAELTQIKLRAEIAAALAREDTLTATPAQTVVAVLAPDASALSDRFKPLTWALADFAATELKQVKSLTVVERRRIDALEQELQLADAGLVDPATAPRAGRILGAGTLLGGRLAMLSDSSLRYDGIAFSLGGTASALPLTEDLENFLELEKSLVFAFLDTLGIELTKAERDAIGEPPTESFLAVLAYAQGLDAQRHGDFSSARRSFDHAARLDPGFSAARNRSVQASASAAGAREGSTAAAVQKVGRHQKHRRPLLRRLTRFGPLPTDIDIPYTIPEGLLRRVVIEVQGGGR